MPAKKLVDLDANVVIGRRLKNLRLDRKMSMLDTAERLGVAWQQIQKYEHGINCPSIVAVQRLAKIYGVSPCEICGCDNA